MSVSRTLLRCVGKSLSQEPSQGMEGEAVYSLCDYRRGVFSSTAVRTQSDDDTNTLYWCKSETRKRLQKTLDNNQFDRTGSRHQKPALT